MSDSTQRYERLMQPGKIGPVTTRNRIIKTANGTSYMEPDQTVGERMIAYYERLAKGGVGFLVVESCGTEYPLAIQHVHYFPDGSYEGVQLHFDDDRFIPGFQRLTEAVHKHGCPVSIQFQHAGPWNPTGLLPRDPMIRDIKCASALTQEELPGPDFLPCRAMTKEEVEDQIDQWASAAERAWKAGFDACEINHGTFHQGNTFLSRVWNKRDDEYGPQSFENRTRFIRNIITEAKRRCGSRLRRPRSLQHRGVQPSSGHHHRRRRGDGQGHRRGRRRHQLPGRALRPPRRAPAARPDPLPGAIAAGSARGSRLEPERPRGHGTPGGSGQSQGREDPRVDRLSPRRRPGRGLPAARQPRLRGHDPPSAGRSRTSQQGQRRAHGGHPRLPWLPLLLRLPQQEQEARVPGERDPGARDRARVSVSPRRAPRRRSSSWAAARPVWRPRA